MWRFSRLGVLTGAFKTIEELSEEDWDATLDTNLKGTFLSAKYVSPLLRQPANPCY